MGRGAIANFFDDAGIDRIALGQRTACMVKDSQIRILRGLLTNGHRLPRRGQLCEGVAVHAQPVVSGHFGRTVDVVVRHIPTAVIVVAARGRFRNASLHVAARGGAGFVVVGHHVDGRERDRWCSPIALLLCFATVGAFIAPVVEHVVPVIVVPATRRPAGVATVVVSNQVVMIGAVLVSPDSAETMRPVRLGAGFGDHAPLNRDVFIVVQGEHLVAAPTGRHVIQNDVLSVSSADRVTLVVRSDPEIPNDDIIGVDAEIAFDRDSISRSGLSGDGDVILLDPHISIDRARHLEDDDSRPLGIASRLKAARSGGVEIGHRDHLAAATACSLGAVAFRAGKGGDDRQARWRLVSAAEAFAASPDKVVKQGEK